MQSIKKLTEQKWSIQGFNACANYISLAGMSGIEDMHKVLGYGYTQILLAFKKEYLEFHYLEDDFRNIGTEFMQRYRKNKNYFTSLLGKDKEFNEKSSAVYETIKEQLALHNAKTKTLSRKEIISLHHQAFEAYHSGLSVGHIIEGITYVLEKEILHKLMKELQLNDAKEAAKIMNELSQPIRPSFISEEHHDLLKILKVIVRNSELLSIFKTKNTEEITHVISASLKEKIEQHAEKYFYYQLNYYHAESLQPIDYIKELREMVLQGVDPEEQIPQEINRYTQNIHKRDHQFKELKLSQQTRELLDLSVDILHWQDDRKKFILVGAYYMHKTLKLIADTFDKDLELLKRLHPPEITLELLQNFDEEAMKKRVEHFILYHWYNPVNHCMDTRVFDKAEYDLFIEQSHKQHNQLEDLHGLSASTGKAIGKVRICKTKEEIAQFQDGEILVASMTRPEFIPAMKKAAAIVTDEGGITCHAAIVSRELNIPCVIGTKIATKILKNGMMIEVRANHGLVKILI